ncbi:MAG: hypothetical protein EB127_07305, partial [Alphaproteobacteria bacterium]|nr:hypothetical protein [Alphaproteobacteria bacterium]
MTKLGIYGYGKMGSAIHKIALANHQFDNVVTCDKDDKIEDLILASDLILDFSINIATEYLIESLLKSPSHVNGLLIGTTSLSPKSIDAINILAKNMAVLCAPNVSLGANLLAKLASNVAKILGKKYDIDIIEKHHKHKVDAPSGTALMIANSIAETRDLAIDAKPLSPRKESTISLLIDPVPNNTSLPTTPIV